MKLQGKRILIVGASKGLGKSLARVFLRRNCRLILFSRSVEDLRLDPEFKASEDQIQYVVGDIRRTEDIERLAQLIERGSELDGVIVAAGVSRPDFVENPDANRAIDTIQVNLEGPIRVYYRLLPLLINRKGTFLAGFASMAGERGMPRAHTYSASKAGLDRFLDSLRIDLLDRGVHVFTIVPGYIETPMTAQNHFPMPGIWPADKAAEHLVKAMEREQYVIRFPWYHSIGIWLITLLPNRFYWWLMSKQRLLVNISPRPEDGFNWPCGS
ncbi:MAG: SDR family NAD(P)-dependent oxidoreductase [Candidatus Ozemobacteraceae bacterium]